MEYSRNLVKYVGIALMVAAIFIPFAVVIGGNMHAYPYTAPLFGIGNFIAFFIGLVIGIPIAILGFSFYSISLGAERKGTIKKEETIAPQSFGSFED